MVVVIAHKVKCPICGEIFDRDTVPFVQNGRRYTHVACFQSLTQKQLKEQADKKQLEEYIMKLFNTEFVPPRIQKQIDQYVRDYHFTYSGIRKSLIYFYEIKKNSLDKANGGISIVPYIYDRSKEYFYTIWQAQQKNIDKDFEYFKPVDKEVSILPPKRNIRKKKLFSFLDEEEEDD